MFRLKSITWNNDVILRVLGKWGHYLRRALVLDPSLGVSLFCLFVVVALQYVIKPPKLAQK